MKSLNTARSLVRSPRINHQSPQAYETGVPHGGGEGPSLEEIMAELADGALEIPEAIDTIHKIATSIP